MSGFKPYPAYKDSGVEWLGEVPEYWSVTSISRLFEIKAGGDLKVEFFSETRTKEHCFPIYTNAKSESAVYGYTNKSIFPADTITVTGRGDVGFAVYRDHPFDAIIRLLVLKPYKSMAGKYYSYSINSLLIFAEGSSAVNQLSTDQISPYRVLLPSVIEQQKIVSFLDYETARIDALIQEQQRLIELLKEKRHAIISHAVTKGLDSTVQMKDSRVEWLGDVPAHWEVMALKWRSRIKSGDSISPVFIEAESSIDTPIPVIGGNGIMGFTAHGNIAPPVIVIGRVGALCGNIHKISEDAWVSDNALVLEVEEDSLNLAYLAQLLRARDLNEIADKSAQPLITGSKVISQRIPCPSLDEQRVIAKFIESELAKFDKLTLAGEQGIALLKERRSALISAAVTGRIDVRDWQPPVSTQAPAQELEEAV